MKALVFGAGKIARGFVGQLLELSGWETTFVDINRDLVQALNEKGTYTVHILGRPEPEYGCDPLPGNRAG